MSGTQNTTRKPRVCIVVPLCNEEESLPGLREKLDALTLTLSRRFALNYCFVNDGSTDGTKSLMRMAIPHGVPFALISHPTNRGVGAAFRTAFSHMRPGADVVCTIDADCSYAPEDLTRLIEVIVRGEADVVTASPYHPLGTVDGVEGWRLVLSQQCSRLYRSVLPLKLYTYTSIFRAYRGSVAAQIRFPSDGFVAAVEMLVSAASLGYRVAEVPAVLHKRDAGCSKMRIAQTIGAHLSLISRCMWAQVWGSYPDFAEFAPDVDEFVEVTLHEAVGHPGETGHNDSAHEVQPHHLSVPLTAPRVRNTTTAAI